MLGAHCRVFAALDRKALTLMRLLEALTRKSAIGKSHSPGVVSTWAAVVYGLCALGFAVPMPVQAITVAGDVTVNTVWSAAQSPVVLQGQVTLDQDATLTIEPGVQVRMDPSSSFTLKKGAVRALGTQSQPIVITSSKADPAPGDWGVWRFTEGTRGAQTIWDHVRVEYGSGILIERSSPTLNNVAVRYHAGPAIRVDLESSPVGQGLSAEGNTLNGVLVPPGVIAGQVSWALVGIPYFVERGLVEVGTAQVTMEPAQLALPPGTNLPMRLVLKKPTPPGGRVVNLSQRGAGDLRFDSAVSLPEGAMEARFVVSAVNSARLGSNTIVAQHPDFEPGVAKVLVIEQPRLYLGYRTNQMLVNNPYTLSANLFSPAPAGGLTVQLVSEPAGALQHPATVVIPEGVTSAEFVVQGKAPHSSAHIAAQAPNTFSDQGLDLRFVDQLEVNLDYVYPRKILVGDQFEVALRPIFPPAPRGGWKVQVSSSDSSVVSIGPGETTVGGEEYYAYSTPPVLYTGVSPGEARISTGGQGVAPRYVDIQVRTPTVLLLEPASDDGQIAIEEGATGRVRVGRQMDDSGYYGTDDIWITLRCEDTRLCEQQNVMVPAHTAMIDVNLTAGVEGTTRLIAETWYATSASVALKVVKPQVARDDASQEQKQDPGSQGRERARGLVSEVAP